jgi:hypothetical protein
MILILKTVTQILKPGVSNWSCLFHRTIPETQFRTAKALFHKMSEGFVPVGHKNPKLTQGTF